MVLPPLDFESSASAISPPRLQISTGKIIARNGLIKKKIAKTNFSPLTTRKKREKKPYAFHKTIELIACES